jgi:RNA polymerase-associated protein CTR9
LRQGLHDRAARLARAALERADADPLRAEAHTILARAHHALASTGDAGEELKEAIKQYEAAAKLDPTLPLPRLGLAQLALLKGDARAAVAELEGALDSAPAWRDALCLLGRLYPRVPGSNPTKTSRQFVAAGEAPSGSEPGDAEVWELFGDSMAGTDPSGSFFCSALWMSWFSLYFIMGPCFIIHSRIRNPSCITGKNPNLTG